MNISLPSSHRMAVLASALMYAGLAFGGATSAAPVAAQSSAYYTATLAMPAQEDRAVAGGIAWVCRDTTCVANKGNSRPLRICRSLAREFGEITGFVADGEALEGEKLARCNGK